MSPAPTAAPVLEVRDLHAYYGQSHILHGISFTIPAGACVSLMGRNGMGKTTTLRSITGLLRPREGEVRVAGVAMTGSTPQAISRAGIALVPEGRGIFPSLTVLENLVMAARPGPDGSNDWTLDRILGLFPRLKERMTNLGFQLSGGEQQMLTVGRALMTNPKLLMLDEATEGLAPLVRREIWRVLHGLKEAGVATLVVDKDVKALLRICDHHLVIAKGRIVHQASSAELARDPDAATRHLGVA